MWVEHVGAGARALVYIYIYIGLIGLIYTDLPIPLLEKRTLVAYKL